MAANPRHHKANEVAKQFQKQRLPNLRLNPRSLLKYRVLQNKICIYMSNMHLNASYANHK